MDRGSASPAFQTSVPLPNPGSFTACSPTSSLKSFLRVSRFSIHHRTRQTSPFPSPLNTPSVEGDLILPPCIAASGIIKTAEQFDKRMVEGLLAICFVGMSNCGKSHWSGKLENNLGFHTVSVDEEIERAIKPELTALGYSGIGGLAEWMGFPSDDRFRTNQARYLEYEESITAAASPLTGKNTVLDTTGSVIYLREDTLNRIRNEYLVVHLQANDDMLEVMTNNYFKTPKPVVWGDAYKPSEGETLTTSLRRCYPNLLRERRKKYAAMSDITIPASISLSRDLELDKFLDLIKSNLM